MEGTNCHAGQQGHEGYEGHASALAEVVEILWPYLDSSCHYLPKPDGRAALRCVCKSLLTQSYPFITRAKISLGWTYGEEDQDEWPPHQQSHQKGIISFLPQARQLQDLTLVVRDQGASAQLAQLFQGGLINVKSLTLQG